jgi:hypothetical protein
MRGPAGHQVQLGCVDRAWLIVAACGQYASTGAADVLRTLWSSRLWVCLCALEGAMLALLGQLSSWRALRPANPQAAIVAAACQPDQLLVAAAVG